MIIWKKQGGQKHFQCQRLIKMTKAEKTRLWYLKNKERKKEYNKMYWLNNKLRLKIKKCL